jgi:hypothetical protein
MIIAGTESAAKESGSCAELLETFSLADELPLLLEEDFTLTLLEDISSISSTDESKDDSTTKSSFPQAASMTTKPRKTNHLIQAIASSFIAQAHYLPIYII